MDFQDWRDDICLVYGKTYARVRTAEVRSSINRPLLKSHVNESRVYLCTRPRGGKTRARTRVFGRMCAATPIHAKSSRELFFRLFLRRGCHNSLSIAAIDSVFSFSLSLSGPVWCPRAFIALLYVRLIHRFSFTFVDLLLRFLLIRLYTSTEQI